MERAVVLNDAREDAPVRERRPLRPVILLDCDVGENLCKVFATALRRDFPDHVIRNAPWDSLANITPSEAEAIAVRLRGEREGGLRMDSLTLGKKEKVTGSFAFEAARHNEAQIAAYLTTQLRRMLSSAAHTANDKD